MDERLAFTHGRTTEVMRRAAPAKDADITDAPPPHVPAPARERTDWAYIGLLLFTATLYFRPQDSIPFLAVIPMSDTTALFALAALVVGRLNRGQFVTRVTPELAAVLGLAGVMLFTAPFSIWPGGAVKTFTDLYLKVVLIFVLIINTLTTPKRVERFMWVVVAGCSYLAFRAVFDYARGFNLIENGRVQGAVGGMFQNPNDLALNMVSIMPLAALLAIRATSIPTKLLAGGGAFLMIGATILSQSRGGFVGLVAMLVVFAVYVGRRRPAFIAAGGLAVVLALPLVPASYWERVSSITDDSLDASGSRDARRVLLGEAWRAFLAYPLTGVGAGNFSAYDPRGRAEPWQETHNAVLQVASELGIAGLLLFLYLVSRAALAGRQTARLLRRAAGTPRRRRWGAAPPPAAPPGVVTPDEVALFDVHSAAMNAAIAGWFFSALFASVAYHWTFYYLLALAVAPRDILLDRLAGRSVPDSTAAARAKYRKPPLPAEARA